MNKTFPPLSPIHIKDMGINWTILGHSERRTLFGESSQVVANKCRLALDSGLDVIACIGEKLNEREGGQTMDVIKSQLDPLKSNLPPAPTRFVLARPISWLNPIVFCL